MSFQTLFKLSRRCHQNYNILDWWVKNADKLPSWATAYKKIVLCQPSSAASERISLLKNLEDYIEDNSIFNVTMQQEGITFFVIKLLN